MSGVSTNSCWETSLGRERRGLEGSPVDRDRTGGGSHGSVPRRDIYGGVSPISSRRWPVDRARFSSEVDDFEAGGDSARGLREKEVMRMADVRTYMLYERYTSSGMHTAITGFEDLNV